MGNTDDRAFCPRCQRQYVSMGAMLAHVKEAHPDLHEQLMADEEPVR